MSDLTPTQQAEKYLTFIRRCAAGDFSGYNGTVQAAMDFCTRDAQEKAATAEAGRARDAEFEYRHADPFDAEVGLTDEQRFGPEDYKA